ncbi:ribonuclease P protein component [Nesterenkonia pannonica]|uniref:ribonuclease P protein component n=1 Tax=Nesterenkonia pannonica TaxID=1548602 RepID=UPI0021641208|nr:ribonuclease P protein component [Nesterenkonia pannonica]
MLPVEHRIRKAQDFRAILRSGARAGTSTSVVVVRVTPLSAEERLRPVRWRAGLVVSKAVGNAVVRHRTARRLRHICAEIVPPWTMDGHRLDIVVRALPPSQPLTTRR